MSDSSFSDDELLSSHLDGDLTAEDEARLASRLEVETDLRDRLLAMSGAAELLSTPVEPLRTGDRDRLLAAALAASTTATNVTDLGAARESKNRWRTRIITVAAGVAALAIAVPVLRSIDNGDGSYTTTGDMAFAESAPDDSTAASDDSAEEAVLQAPAADALLESSALAGGADEAPDDSTDSGNAAQAEPVEPATAGDLSYLNAFTAPAPDFDPLPDDLGDFADQSTVITALTDAWRDYVDRPQEAPNDTSIVPDPGTVEVDDEGRTVVPRQDVLERAYAYLDGFGGCGSAIDELVDVIAELPPVLAVDWSVARRGGITFTVGLFRLVDNDAFAVVIDPSTCTTIDQFFLA
jgi:hypothetical protein